MEGTRMASIQFGSESHWKFMGDFEVIITQTDRFWENVGESVWNLEWNWCRRREKPVWKLHNRLLDVKEDKSVRTRS